MNPTRLDLVRIVFKRLDKDRSGMLDFNDI